MMAAPSLEELQKMWQEMQVTHDPSRFPAVDGFLHHLRDILPNGKAEFVQFHVTTLSVLRTSGWNRQWAGFFSQFLTSAAVALAMPTFETNEASVSSAEFQRLNAIMLECDLARVFMEGGAYIWFEGTPREAKSIAKNFCDAVISDAYDDMDALEQVYLFKTKHPWAKWFTGLVHETWFGFDNRQGHVWILCYTDRP